MTETGTGLSTQSCERLAWLDTTTERERHSALCYLAGLNPEAFDAAREFVTDSTRRMAERQASR